MTKWLTDMQEHSSGWPFIEPVNPETVADYYDVIKKPMGMSIISLLIRFWKLALTTNGEILRLQHDGT